MRQFCNLCVGRLRGRICGFWLFGFGNSRFGENWRGGLVMVLHCSCLGGLTLLRLGRPGSARFADGIRSSSDLLCWRNRLVRLLTRLFRRLSRLHAVICSTPEQICQYLFWPLSPARHAAHVRRSMAIPTLTYNSGEYIARQNADSWLLLHSRPGSAESWRDPLKYCLPSLSLERFEGRPICVSFGGSVCVNSASVAPGVAAKES